MTDVVINGDTVTLHFVLSLADGTVVEATTENEPMVLTLGQGDMHHGLEAYLHGLAVGDHSRFSIAPGEAFEEPDPEQVHIMPRTDFPGDMELEAGYVVEFDGPGGEPVAGTVMEIDEDNVVVDFNHPLAGRDLVFEVEIIDIQSND